MAVGIAFSPPPPHIKEERDHAPPQHTGSSAWLTFFSSLPRIRPIPSAAESVRNQRSICYVLHHRKQAVLLRQFLIMNEWITQIHGNQFDTMLILQGQADLTWNITCRNFEQCLWQQALMPLGSQGTFREKMKAGEWTALLYNTKTPSLFANQWQPSVLWSNVCMMRIPDTQYLMKEGTTVS